jgi:hypothetical protein
MLDAWLLYVRSRDVWCSRVPALLARSRVLTCPVWRLTRFMALVQPAVSTIPLLDLALPGFAGSWFLWREAENKHCFGANERVGK